MTLSNSQFAPTIRFDQLKQIFELSVDGILVTDAFGQIIFATPSSAVFMNLSLNVIIGSNVKDLVAQGYYDRSIIWKAIETKQRQSGVVVMANQNKVFSTATPYFDDRGNITMVITNVRPENILDKYVEELNREKERNSRYRTALTYLNRLNSETDRIIAKSPQFIQILEYLDKISRTASTVLLLGESGTGKEVLAKFIHKNSRRNSEPFIPVNCSAIPKDLMESEFFGYDKGAFTGALASGKPGFLEMSENGTLFLDEIGELPLDMQAKLLRAIELGEFKRLGGNRVLRVDTRIIAATNQNLDQLVEKGEFRKDLFYRLNVIPVKVPPLRERKEDILELARYFFSQYFSKEECEDIVNNELTTCFLNYDWPGNIREMKNMVERIAIDMSIDPNNQRSLRMIADLVQQSPSRNSQGETTVTADSPETQPVETLQRHMQALEKNYLLFALTQCNWNISLAATQLGIHRSLLYRKMKQHHLARATTG